jgi:hypothetical protein
MSNKKRLFDGQLFRVNTGVTSSGRSVVQIVFKSDQSDGTMSWAAVSMKKGPALAAELRAAAAAIGGRSIPIPPGKTLSKAPPVPEVATPAAPIVTKAATPVTPAAPLSATAALARLNASRLGASRHAAFQPTAAEGLPGLSTLADYKAPPPAPKPAPAAKPVAKTPAKPAAKAPAKPAPRKP